MLGNFEGWLVSVVAIVICWTYLLYHHGPSIALGVSVVLSFCFPVWLVVDVGGLPLSVQTATAIMAMLGYVVHPEGRILSPLTLLDFCIALMCICHVTADSFATGFTIALPFRAYGEWALPFVAGRFAIRDKESLKRLAPWVVAVLFFLGVMSCCEALTKVNPFELVFGSRPEGLAHRNGERLGIKRAFGPTTHSIFFGMIFTVLMPWLVCMWQSFDSTRIRRFILLAAVVAFAGAVLTMSRTPLLTILAVSAMTVALRVKILRWPMGISMALAIGGFLAFPTEITDEVSRWTGGGNRPWLIEIDGEAVVSSSSRTRLHVFGIYSNALVKGGPFGYGSMATAGFPLKIPNMEATIKSANLFVMVDNAYILLTLRFGWLGGICLILLFLTAIVTSFLLYTDRPDRIFPGVMGCMLAVIACFSFLLVFMNYDFGLPLLWTIGVLAGLASARIGRIPRSTRGKL